LFDVYVRKNPPPQVEGRGEDYIPNHKREQGNCISYGLRGVFARSGSDEAISALEIASLSLAMTAKRFSDAIALQAGASLLDGFTCPAIQ